MKKKNKKRHWIWCIRPRYRNKFVERILGWMLPKKIMLIVDYGKVGGVMQQGRFFVEKFNRIQCRIATFAHFRDIVFYRLEVYRKK